MKKYSELKNKNMLLKIKNTVLFLFTLLILGCDRNNNSLTEVISPCENAFKKELEPIKKIVTSDFFNARLLNGARTSDKYLVTSGDINRTYKYMVVNHKAQTVNYFEKPYILGWPLSDSRLYQIHNDHLYLARLDRTLGWILEAVHLETMDNEVIPLMLENEMPKEILQVEKFENEIYILASFAIKNIIFSYDISNKTLKIIHNPTDEYYTMGFKVLQFNPNNNFILRAAIDSINSQTIIEGINITTQFTFYKKTFDRLLRTHNFPHNTEILPFDSNNRIYLNFIDSKSTIIEAKTGNTVFTSDKNLLPLSNDYTLSYFRFGEEIKPNDFEIIEPITGKSLINASWEKHFYNSELLNAKHLLISTYYAWEVLNLETKCIEYNGTGNFYKTKENEFISVDGDGLYFYKL